MYLKNSLLKILISTKTTYFGCATKSYSTNNGKISTVGFIGLGVMGGHMAKHLIKKFKTLRVYDVHESAALNVAKEGATAVKQVNDLSDSDCIISMLPANQHVLDVYKSSGGLISKVKPGTLIIDCSTVDPQVPQTLAEEAQQKNVTFIDAPVSGGVLAAASATLTFMVGGSVEGVKRSEPILRLMGKNVVHCGASGSGQTAKICNNMLLGISMIGVAEAMNLGIRQGLEPKLLASVINSSSGRCWSSDAYNPVPGVLENVPASKNYKNGFLSRLIAKDLTLAQSLAERTETSTPLGKHALDIYKNVCDSGKAELDFSVVYEFIKEFSKK